MSLSTFSLLSKGSVLPSLQQLNLFGAKVAVKDFSRFVLKHCDTLMRLTLWFVDLQDGTLEDFRGFLTGLRDFPKIEYLNFMILRFNEDLVRFPLTSQAIDVDVEDEPEYAWVRMIDCGTVRMEGTEEVREGLTLMAECIAII
jgi:hypothetical protein